MDVKSFIKIGLFSVGIPAMNIGSAFAFSWKCSLGEKHKKFEVCQATRDRYCDKCKVVHFGWNVCPQTVFLIPGEGCKIVCMPLGTENTEIVDLQVRYGYGEDGKKINSANSFPSIRDRAEISRLSRFVHALKKKYLPKKAKGKKEGKFLNRKRNASEEVGVEDKKEGDGVEGEFLNKEGSVVPWEAEVEDKKEGDESAKDIGDDNKECKVLTKKQRWDRELLWHIESGEPIKWKQSEVRARNEKENEKKPYSDEEDEGAIKQKRSKKKK